MTHTPAKADPPPAEALEQQYAAAFADWERAPDAAAWDATSNDGLQPEG